MLDLAALGIGSEYTRRLVTVSLVREKPPTPYRRMRSADQVFEDFRSLGNLDREAFLALFLDHKNRINGLQVVSVGSLSAALVHPREVFKGAILANAAAIIVLHNHPSGDPTPSAEDREITTRLKRAGELLGIPLLDHVIIGAGEYRSLSEMGLL